MLVVIVVLVVVAVVVLVGLALRRRDMTTVTFPGPLTALDVHLPAGGVRVEGSTGDGAVVTREIRWLLRKPRLDERIDGGVLRLRAEGSPLTSGIVEYTVQVPPGTAVTAWSTAGQISVQGVSGGVEARSNTGGIDLEDVGGALRLKTSTGAIHGEALVSADVEANTSSGSVELAFAIAPERIAIDCETGTVEVKVPDDRYAVETKSEEGDVDVTVTADADAARRITIVTGTGAIRIAPSS